jgi:hypothetical protein
MRKRYIRRDGNPRSRLRWPQIEAPPGVESHDHLGEAHQDRSFDDLAVGRVEEVRSWRAVPEAG